MIRYILLALAIYVLYKLVFDVIVPVFRASKLVHRQFKDIQQKMQEQQNATKGNYPPDNKHTPHKKQNGVGDYIDFEELK